MASKTSYNIQLLTEINKLRFLIINGKFKQNNINEKQTNAAKFIKSTIMLICDK